MAIELLVNEFNESGGERMRVDTQRRMCRCLKAEEEKLTGEKKE
jgi:hypothetical protein